MNGLTSEKTETIGRIAGIIGMLAFFFPFVTGKGRYGVSESRSGIQIILAWFQKIILSTQLDSAVESLILWTIVAFVAGFVGVMATLAINGGLYGGISHAVGVVSLYLLKDLFESEGVYAGAGWTIALIAYIVSTACAFATLYLAGKEVEKRKQENRPSLSNLSDDDLTRLRDELANYRAQDDDKQ